MHLGNKDCHPDGFFFAYDLLDEDDAKHFKFKSGVGSNVFKILRELISTSSTAQIHFTSDWQFSENAPSIVPEAISIDDFEKLNRAEGIPLTHG